MTERAFLSAGEMGRRISQTDWSATPLGPIHDWPQSLKTAVSLMLTSRYPMFVWWGDELVNLYNDGYVPILGDRHPSALGRSAHEIWHEIWDEVGPQAELALREGRSTWQEQTLLCLQRYEFTEETYFTYSYSPLRDDGGRLAGLFCTCSEETQRVLDERRLHVLRRIAEVGTEADSVEEASVRIAGVLRNADRDVAFALLYLADEEKEAFRLAGRSGEELPEEFAPEVVPFGRWQTGAWDFAPALSGEVREVPLPVEAGLPGGAWPEAARAAAVLPLASMTGGRPLGLLVAGISPRLSYDDGYARFFQLVASGAASAVAGAREFEAERQRAEALAELSRVRAESARREERIRARARSSVREVEDRFRRMADSAPTMIWVTDSGGEVIFLSRSWYEFTGQTREEGLKHGWVDAVHPEDRDDVLEAFLAANDRQESFQVEYRLRRADGAYQWMLDAATPYVDDDGVFHGYVGSVIDVSARREAEIALRQSEERFRMLANSIPQLAWMARPDGHIFWYNRRWYDYTGTTLEEMEGWGWKSVHDPEELPRVLSHFKAAIDAGVPWEDTFPLRRHDGEMRWHLSRALPLRDDDGDVVMWFGTNTDISDRREMESALREADRRKNRFLATLAHELRNPLAPLANGLELLNREPDPDTAAKVRATMDRQLGNIVRLVDDLLEVTRVSLGKIELQTDRVCVADAVHMAVETTKSAVSERGHELTVELPEERLEVTGDRMRLEQVFANLLHNAARYTQEEGHLRIEVSRENGNARVDVVDDGIGVPPEFRTTIFEVFSQGNAPGNGLGTGLGIGLTIVQQLVDLHGGTVEVESEGAGKGSRFIVRLPLAPEMPIETAAEDVAGREEAAVRDPGSDGATETNTRGWTGRRVLVVDDNQSAADILTLLVEMLGHEVKTALDGIEALELGDQLEPDVVLLDIGLPGMGGYEICRMMRERAWGSRARIVAVTGWGQEEDRLRSREAGFDVHLVKPVARDDLEDVLTVVA